MILSFGADHHRKILGVILVVGLHDGRMRNRWMQIDRYIERFRAREDRPEALVVDKGPVCQSVDHGAFELVFGHRTLELLGGSFRVARRQGGEGGEPLRVHGNRGRQAIIHALGEFDGDIAAELLGGRGAMGEHLHVDAGVIHLLKPQFAEIVDALDDFRIADRFHALIVRN